LRGPSRIRVARRLCVSSVSAGVTPANKVSATSNPAEPDLARVCGIGRPTRDASDRVSFEDCPSCGGAATVGWLEADFCEIDCHSGCAPRIAQTPAFPSGPDGDTMARAEVLVDLFGQAILDTAATLKLTDPRKAAALVASAWADVSREEGRSLRIVDMAAAAVRGLGERMHRRYC
jgi:hypothetical protein